MRCAVYAAVGVAMVFGPGAALVKAQHHAAPMATPGFYNGMTPNSTIDGDAARMSSYAGLISANAGAVATQLNALGMFNLNRAYADAIDQHTMMTWNEYYWACMDEECRRSRAARAERHKRLIRLYNERRERVANRPDELDLLNGDALNELLGQLSNPKIHPFESLKKNGESIPGETIQRCAFSYPSVGMTISLGRLTVRDGWPQALRGNVFAPERAAYRKAVETALEQNLAGNLAPEAFRAIQNAVQALKIKVAAAIPPSQKEDYAQAQRFLDDLDQAVAPLHDPTGEKVLAGVDRYAGTTVGDAVLFMQRFNLRFAPALTAEERESYHVLYAAMLRLQTKIDPGAAVKNPNLKKPADIVPPDLKL